MITASSSTDNRYNQLSSQLLQSQISSGNAFSKNHKLMLVTCSGGGELVTSGSRHYCKTLNASVRFISRAKQNREIKGREYQLQAKTGRNYYSILNCVVSIRQNRRGQNNFTYKVANF